jgi:ankyrin repeat protein
VTLDETYERILLGIDKEKHEHAIRLLQCLAFSRRPLGVNELAEVLATRFDAGQIPKLHKDQRSRKPDEDVLLAGSTLITTIKPGVQSNTRVVQFSHYSVVEFLTSERLASSKNEDLSQYYITPESAHITLAQTCISTLLQLDNHVKGVTQDFPLAEYAAQNWFHHAQYKDVAPRIQDGLNCLFDPDGNHFTVWLSVHNIDHVPSHSRFSKHPTPEPSPLYYATLCGIRSVVEYLVITCRHHPNNSHGGRGTPLQAAVVLGHIAIAQFLLEHDADVNVRDKSNSTLLHEASESGNLDVMELLLSHGADVNVLDYRGDSPLHKASRYQKLDAIKLLVSGGADVNVRDKHSSTPLHKASGGGDLDVMQLLLNGRASVDVLDEWGDSPLHKAFQYQRFDAVKLLVKGGADVNVRDKSNSTRLHEASGSGNLDVMKLLLNLGADVNVLDHRGDSPLHKASRHQKLDAIKLLVSGGADVNIRDKSNSTPLHEASGSGILHVMGLLLSLGADVNALDYRGDSALHKASRYQKEHAVNLLVDGNADVNVRDKSNSTPLHEASGSRNLDLAQLLLTHGADVNVFDHWGDSPLHKSFRSLTFDIVGTLYCVKVTQDAYNRTLIRTTSSGENFNLVPPLSRKCTGAMNARDKGRSTPVHDAPQGENYAMAQLLLAHGADVNVRGWRDKTPLNLASIEGSLDVSRLLIEHGADDVAQTPSSLEPARGHRKLTQLLLNNRVLGKTMGGTSCVKLSALYLQP